MDEDPDGYRILKLRAEILELGSISRKRALLEHLVKTNPKRGTLAS